MTAKALTDRFCRSVRPVDGKQSDHPDATVRGLALRVSAQGGKSWTFRYRNVAGRQCRVSLGEFPAVELADARLKALRLKAEVADGVDPAAEKRKAKARASAPGVRTFGDLVQAYFEACEAGRWRPKGKTKRPATLVSEKGAYERYLKKPLGNVELAEITRSLVKATLRAVADRGITAQANKAHQVVRQAFSYAIAEEIAPDVVVANPAQGFAPVAVSKPRTRVLTDAELKAFWRALHDPSSVPDPKGEGPPHAGRPVRIVLALCLLLLQRKSEVAGMRLSELDLDRGLWVVSPERMKNNRPHAVPLPARAVELIREALALKTLEEKARGAKTPGDPVFPSPRAADKPIRGDSVYNAMSLIVERLAIKDASPHDLRRTGSTLMTSERLGVSQFVRSLVLSHTSDAGGGAAVSRAHYDLNGYLPDKRAALTAWEGLLLELVGERVRPENVAQLRGAAA